MKMRTTHRTLPLVLVCAFLSAWAAPLHAKLSVAATAEWISFQAPELPEIAGNRLAAEPIGVGAAAVGGETFDICIALDAFDGSMDVYLARYAPAVDPRNLYPGTPGGGLDTLTNLPQTGSLSPNGCDGVASCQTPSWTVRKP